LRLLVDTHLLIWAALGHQRLPKAAARILNSTEHDLAFSAASLWEMTIKHALGWKDFDIDVPALRAGFLRLGYEELPITGTHALRVADLPRHHGDPFDRLLIAQAASERRVLLTSDRHLQAYGNIIRRV
jgi:PIN domain nuclease of toxin-antitoxin system